MVAFPEEIEKTLSEGLLGQWYVVAKSVEVERGKTLAVKLLGRRLVLWRGEDGAVRCTDNYCPHRGAPLSMGLVIDNDLSCHYHGVTVDGDGTIVRVPAMQTCALEGRNGVRSYAVQELADGIFAYFPSAEYPEPRPFTPPPALRDDGYAKFLCVATWNADWRYVLDNLVDPMHGTYLHTDTFTLGNGGKEADVMKLSKLEDGFRIERVGQQDVNFDFSNARLASAVPHVQLSVPYPAAAGPGGALQLLPLFTPVEPGVTRIFFWRMRKATGFAAEAWKFLFRARLERFAWEVIEQDREMIEAMPSDARNNELLYQHDIGIGRARQMLTQRAKAQRAAEIALEASA